MPWEYKLNTPIKLEFGIYADAANSGVVTMGLMSDLANVNDQSLSLSFGGNASLIGTLQYTTYTALNSGVATTETPIHFRLYRGYTAGTEYTGAVYLVGLCAVYQIDSQNCSSSTISKQ
jgi:hypothetical protein